MQSQEEWRFEFLVSSQVLLMRTEMNSLLNEVIAWAQARTLGFAGGYGPEAPEVGSAASAWRFEFDLVVNDDDLLIPESQATELLAMVQSWCRARELSFAGGFSALTPKESGQVAQDSQAV